MESAKTYETLYMYRIMYRIIIIIIIVSTSGQNNYTYCTVLIKIGSNYKI